MIRVDAAVRSHVGSVRTRNEDAAYAGRHLVAVADGLGGHVAGDVASRTVIDVLRSADRAVEPARLPDHLGRAVADANTALGRRVEAEPELRGMGTTLVALAWAGSAAVLANIGDSRGYRLRAGVLTPLTEDHVYGRLVSAAARVPNLPPRLARYLDGRADGRSPDLTRLDLVAGDRLLLCTDGLSSYVPADRIAAVLAAAAPPTSTADRLVEAALDVGGPDNITVAVLDVQPGRDAEVPFFEDGGRQQPPTPVGEDLFE